MHCLLSLLIIHITGNGSLQSIVSLSAISIVWNKIIPNVLNSPELDIGRGVVIPGSSVNSDSTSPIPFIKNRVKKIFMIYRNTEILFNG